jgi:DNA invertase Pin-like site-specific DNA recombinase
MIMTKYTIKRSGGKMNNDKKYVYRKVKKSINKTDKSCPQPTGAYIYCRLSYSSKNKHSYSLNTQKDQCETYCNNNNIAVKGIVSEVKSSRNMENYNKLDEIVDKMVEGDILIISNVSRFSRNMSKGLQLLDKIYAKRAKIYSVEENISYDTCHDKYSFREHLNLAEREGDIISNRISLSINYLKKHGHTFGIPQFGYETYFNGAVRKLRRNYTEYQIVVKIRNMVNNEKKSFDEIANNLNESNILNRNRKWITSSVKRVYESDKNNLSIIPPLIHK